MTTPLQLAAAADSGVLSVTDLAVFSEALSEAQASVPSEHAGEVAEIRALLDDGLHAWLSALAARHENTTTADATTGSTTTTTDPETLLAALTVIGERLRAFAVRHSGMGLAVLNVPDAADAFTPGRTEYALRVAAPRIRHLLDGLARSAAA